MQKKTIREIEISIPIIVLIVCITAVAAGYWSYITAREFEEQSKQQAKEADAQFVKDFKTWPDTNKRSVDDRLLVLRSNLTVLVKERSAALEMSDISEVQSLCDSIATNLAAQDNAEAQALKELQDIDTIILHLEKDAAKLSTKDKRIKARKVASLTRNINFLDKDYRFLRQEDIQYSQWINDLYRRFAADKIPEDSFNTRVRDYEQKREAREAGADMKLQGSIQKREQLRDAWNDLRPLLV